METSGETLGQLLKREREFRGISREDVTRLTRISQSTIKILEDDLPIPSNQSIYIRSYLKNYARQIGLDPNEVIARFQSERGQAEPPPIPIARPPAAAGSARAIWAAVGVVAVLGLAAYWMKRHGESHRPPAVEVAPEPSMSTDENTSDMSRLK